MRYRPWAHLLAAALMLLTASASNVSRADTTGGAKVCAGSMDAATAYRIANYRAPVTLPSEGGTRISLAQLDELLKPLIDVMPACAGYDPKSRRWRLMERRFDTPSFVWLPIFGEGRLEPRLAAYFASSLKELARDDRNKPLVLYCMADCWMSWNAVKRAASFGYATSNGARRAPTAGWRPGVRSSRAEPPAVPAEQTRVDPAFEAATQIRLSSADRGATAIRERTDHNGL